MGARILVLGVMALFLNLAGAWAQETGSLKTADGEDAFVSAEELKKKYPPIDQGLLKRMLDTNLREYVGVAQESTEACSTRECQDSVQAALALRYVGEGACDKIDQEDKANLCSAVKTRRCNSLDDAVAREFCQAVISGNPQDVMRLLGVMREQGDATEPALIARDLGLVAGYYRFSSTSACQKYMEDALYHNQPYRSLFMCDILFAKDPERIWEAAEKDAVQFNFAVYNKKQEMCEQINSSDLKAICQKRVVAE